MKNILSILAFLLLSFNSLSGQIIQNSNDFPALEMSEIVDILDPVTDLNVEEVYWFQFQLAVLLPEIDASGYKYIITYSTDHALNENAKIAWGVGNNLDGSDFNYQGIITNKGGPETPIIIRNPDSDKPISIYYHRKTGSEQFGIQNTKLISTSGGLLHETIYQDNGNPLTPEGLEYLDQHLGYFKPYQLDSINWRGMGFKSQSIRNDNVPVYNWYRTTTDSLDHWKRDGTLDVRSKFEDERFWSYTFGSFFEYLDHWWWIGNTNPSQITNSDNKQWFICRATKDLKILDPVLKLTGDTFLNTVSVYVEGDIAHLYHNNKSVSVGYATLNLLPLRNKL